MNKLKNIIFIILVNFIVLSIAKNYDKWIVVTTIQYPTPALEKLATLADWRLVVVADKRTPLDWKLPNCDFLSVEQQQQLPYKIVRLLPWNHYSRKNIGYLYAIEHGAKIIYETDDDNILLHDSIKYLPEKTSILNCITSALTFNPYAYFGQSTVWPRGYPLHEINASIPYQLTKQTTTISIQQGLVNNDPDVDAIFRLTHAQEITFEQQEPISLPAKTFCPFNSQNTLFYYRAFWGLLMPITTSFRVCDIWRSYWVQRMLWDIDSAVVFLPANAVQYRNEHNLLKDFADELDLYLKTDQLINTLNQWSSQRETVEQRMLDLMEHLVEHDFFGKQEVKLLHAWLDDLRELNYQMPEIR